jgi:hypothetical protein
MKKINVLVIAYYYPPKTSVGIFRTLGYLKNFSKHDIDATIITHKDKNFSEDFETLNPLPEINEFSVHYVKELPLRWYLRLLQIILLIPFKIWKIITKKKINPKIIGLTNFGIVDEYYGWIVPALLKAFKILKDRDIDIVYLSAPPFSSSLVAFLLKKMKKTPYILDFRDGWAMSSDKLTGNTYRQKDCSRIEKAVIENASKLITNTDSDYNSYRRLFGEDKIELIFNHYWPLKNKPESKDIEFTILFTGVWDYDRSPKNLLQALSECDFSWKLVSIGNTNSELCDLAKKYHFEDRILLLDHLSKDEIEEYMTIASVFYLSQPAALEGCRYTHIATKTFDYLAYGKPILAELPEGDNKDIIVKYAEHYAIAPLNNAAELKSQIIKLYNLWSSGVRFCKPNPTFLHEFSSETHTQQLSDIIKQVLSKTNQV